MLYALIFIPIFRKELVILDYCIKNSKNVYLKLNSKGAPVTCAESIKGTFEYSKAKNILSSLPKSLKRMNFVVQAIPDIPVKEDVKVEKKTIQKENYILSEDITRWVDKFGTCADILNEAKNREKELIVALENIDKEFLDILHSIEIEKPKDMYGGWQQYKYIRNNRERRRNIKDELMIVENVLTEINPDCLQRERVQKAVDGLLGRKYTFRVVEEGEENATM